MRGTRIRGLMQAMLRVGVIGFGGGNALIPVMEKEFVTKKSYVTKEEYDEAVLAASITPGALPVEIACGIGRKYGRACMLLAASLVALPGAVATVALLAMMEHIDEQTMRWLSVFTKAVSLFLIYLLFRYICGIAHEALQESRKRFGKVLLIFVSVFLLCGGKNLYRLMGIHARPLFVLSTVSILGLALFFILWTQGRYSVKRVLVPGILIGAYLACVCLERHYEVAPVKGILVILMIMVTIGKLYVTYIQRMKGMHSVGSIGMTLFGIGKETIGDIVVWLCFLAVCTLPMIILFSPAADYLLKGMYSSFLSYGGGDAYLTVADGVFVDTGMVKEGVFYQQLVAIAIVLPGSILCKILTGVGYLIGYGIHQNIIDGILIAFSGFVCSICASGIVYSIGDYLCKNFEQLPLFELIKRWLHPIIGGLLLNVIVALLNQIWLPMV